MSVDEQATCIAAKDFEDRWRRDEEIPLMFLLFRWLEYLGEEGASRPRVNEKRKGKARVS